MADLPASLHAAALDSHGLQAAYERAVAADSAAKMVVDGTATGEPHGAQPSQAAAGSAPSEVPAAAATGATSATASTALATALAAASAAALPGSRALGHQLLSRSRTASSAHSATGACGFASARGMLGRTGSDPGAMLGKGAAKVTMTQSVALQRAVARAEGQQQALAAQLQAALKEAEPHSEILSKLKFEGFNPMQQLVVLSGKGAYNVVAGRFRL